jgi:hypothetical protein
MSARPAVVPPTGAAATPARGHLFVSTALDIWFTEHPTAFARDVQIDDIAYRRIDPEYYAWLRSRMILAQKAATAGHLDSGAFEALRVRFNAMHEWAVEHLGEDQLLAVVLAPRAGDYSSPAPDDDGPRVPLQCGRKSESDRIPPEAIAMVDAISERALSLGWRHERLYCRGINGTFDPRRGLICSLKPGNRIGDVTLQAIEIIGQPPSEVRQRFYNPDVDQPWVKRIDVEKK